MPDGTFFFRAHPWDSAPLTFPLGDTTPGISSGDTIGWVHPEPDVTMGDLQDLREEMIQLFKDFEERNKQRIQEVLKVWEVVGAHRAKRILEQMVEEPDGDA